MNTEGMLSHYFFNSVALMYSDIPFVIDSLEMVGVPLYDTLARTLYFTEQAALTSPSILGVSSFKVGYCVVFF